jgi:DMATS type aromatic prenyltransferase
MTDDHNPIELSWDWHNGNQAPTVRFLIESVGAGAGSPQDPDNRLVDGRFFEWLTHALPSAHFDLFTYFDNQLGSKLLSTGRMEGHPSKIFYAFDLSEDEMTVKADFFPGLKARDTNSTNLEVLVQAIAMVSHYAGS